MQLARSFSAHPASQPSAVALGNFDGLHLGHCAIIAALKAVAAPMGLRTQIITFAPHPRDYFAKLGRGMPVAHIYSVRERLALLADAGIDRTLLLRFNTALATLSPKAFASEILAKQCHAKIVLVGRDVRFGHQRAGDLTLLRSLGEQLGFAVQVLEDVMQGEASEALRISSSSVRQTLQVADVHAAHALLGRPYALSGRVIHGRKIGRTLGCPTLNVNIRLPQPAVKGIWVVAIHGLSEQPLRGVASLGLRPTVESTHRYSLEVHAFDWSGDAYGKRVAIEFKHKLRDEAAYVDLPTLQIAIEQDMRDARVWWTTYS